MVKFIGRLRICLVPVVVLSVIVLVLYAAVIAASIILNGGEDREVHAADYNTITTESRRINEPELTALVNAAIADKIVTRKEHREIMRLIERFDLKAAKAKLTDPQ